MSIFYIYDFAYMVMHILHRSVVHAALVKQLALTPVSLHLGFRATTSPLHRHLLRFILTFNTQHDN